MENKVPSHSMNSKGTFLQPLVFPEAANTDLSHFIDPTMDAPIVCLIPSCDEVFTDAPPSVGVETECGDEKVVKIDHNPKEDGVEDTCVAAVATETDTMKGVAWEEVDTGNMADTDDMSGCMGVTAREEEESVGVETSKMETSKLKSSRMAFSIKDQFLRHLFLVHKIVIDKVDNVCSLRR